MIAFKALSMYTAVNLDLHELSCIHIVKVGVINLGLSLPVIRYVS